MSSSSSRIEIQIDQASTAALQSNLTARFLLETKCRNSAEGRRSAEVIQWAEILVREINPAILNKTGFSDKTWHHTLNVVVVLVKRAYTYVCYDIFIEGCDEQRQARIDGSLEEPIHYILERSGGYSVARMNKI